MSTIDDARGRVGRHRRACACGRDRPAGERLRRPGQAIRRPRCAPNSHRQRAPDRRHRRAGTIRPVAARRERQDRAYRTRFGAGERVRRYRHRRPGPVRHARSRDAARAPAVPRCDLDLRRRGLPFRAAVVAEGLPRLRRNDDPHRRHVQRERRLARRAPDSRWPARGPGNPGDGPVHRGRRELRVPDDADHRSGARPPRRRFLGRRRRDVVQDLHERLPRRARRRDRRGARARPQGHRAPLLDHLSGGRRARHRPARARRDRRDRFRRRQEARRVPRAGCGEQRAACARAGRKGDGRADRDARRAQGRRDLDTRRVRRRRRRLVSGDRRSRDVERQIAVLGAAHACDALSGAGAARARGKAARGGDALRARVRRGGRHAGRRDRSDRMGRHAAGAGQSRGAAAARRGRIHAPRGHSHRDLRRCADAGHRRARRRAARQACRRTCCS